MRESIFYASFRALMVAFFSIIGICLGFMALFMLIGVLSSKSSSSQFTNETTEELLPNAKGERVAQSATSPLILQIDINKEIGGEGLNSKTIRQILVESREGIYKHDRVKGILLYIDSPGGSAIDTDIIFRSLLEYKKKYNIPIYAFVDGICASGSFYIALAADKIFASNVSLIGSVGVVTSPFMNYSKLLDKIGVESLTLSEGKGKDALNPFRPWVEGEDQNYRQIDRYFYANFVDLVTTYRPKISKQKLIDEYGAHVFAAPKALEYGFIDTSGASLHDALSELVTKSEITDDNYQVIRLETSGWFKGLFSGTSMLFSNKMQHQLSVSPEIDLLLKHKYLYLYY